MVVDEGTGENVDGADDARRLSRVEELEVTAGSGPREEMLLCGEWASGARGVILPEGWQEMLRMWCGPTLWLKIGFGN